ncbi:MAG: 50S ribosomal protein L22 [Patescibacteria group bacterium]
MSTTTANTTTASLQNYRATPRKVGLLADFVRGKNAKKALAELTFVNKRHAGAVRDLIASAVANSGMDARDLTIADIQVQEGKSLRRHRAGSRGRAMAFRRRLSHIYLTLTPVVDNSK